MATPAQNRGAGRADGDALASDPIIDPPVATDNRALELRIRRTLSTCSPRAWGTYVALLEAIERERGRA